MGGEVQYEVKNNLGLITSYLETERVNRDPDAAYEDVLDQTNFDSNTLSIIHKLLHQHSRFAEVDLDRFLGDCRKRVFTRVKENDDVSISLQFDNDRNIEVESKCAIQIALLLYELVVYANRLDQTGLNQFFIDFYKTSSNLYISCHYRTDYEVPTIDLDRPDILELQLAQTLLNQLESYF